MGRCGDGNLACAAQHSAHPVSATDTSETHSIFWFAVTGCNTGPKSPSNVFPLNVSLSKFFSVAKVVDERRRSCVGAITQLTLVPYWPG